MEKRTILAIVLSVVVISVGYIIQGTLYPPVAIPETPNMNLVQTEQAVTPSQNSLNHSPGLVQSDPVNLIQQEQTYTISTNLLDVIFTNRGGDIISYKLKQHKDKDDYVQMVLPGAKPSHALSLSFGDHQAAPLTDLFDVTFVTNSIIEFSRDYQFTNQTTGDSIPFTLRKRFEFKQNEYLFDLSIIIDAGYTTISLDDNGIAYTLATGPQIGPSFQKLSQNYEYRKYYSYFDGKMKTEKVNAQSFAVINKSVTWAAVAGKYFALIAIPETTAFNVVFSSKSENDLNEVSKIYILRPSINDSKITDKYKFYLGPKTQKELAIYNNADKNAYKIRDLNISSVVASNGILAPLEIALKWLLVLFYRVIPNYGVAILLLTFVVKAIMFPLTKKSSESTLKMQALAPKIKEIQTKYKDNPNKLNAEMAELYKKEGYNPLSGCLPMLLQIPIFFAMYGLFNNHFDLRGAMFIPGWIPDLSVPESIWNFAPFSIPLLGWSNLRLLPFIYLLSQLLYGRVTQTPDQKANPQMKIMLFAMPIMFFFILYDVPAGLLLYWILSNLLTLVQQVVINRYILRKVETV